METNVSLFLLILKLINFYFLAPIQSIRFKVPRTLKKVGDLMSVSIICCCMDSSLVQMLLISFLQILLAFCFRPE